MELLILDGVQWIVLHLNSIKKADRKQKFAGVFISDAGKAIPLLKKKQKRACTGLPPKLFFLFPSLGHCATLKGWLFCVEQRSEERKKKMKRKKVH
ncbi:hypothetical protein CEXT_583591 [Caerostris extrusa]|uniref:Uncharacterized protein n=1 Tax=Caerostris extrusa TaxID=172846 RepID=A0AAV4XN94_CAEEX|nr:hypothetical protein CEXT_583591 [Caerostris extrusa]